MALKSCTDSMNYRKCRHSPLLLKGQFNQKSKCDTLNTHCCEVFLGLVESQPCVITTVYICSAALTDRWMGKCHQSVHWHWVIKFQFGVNYPFVIYEWRLHRSCKVT